ncbi:MAG TPA: hypothetical protein VD997_12885 [Phycisphaerales bacterium]|nr:hypothetical protein [Phycisphaerales bacterium]
MQARGPVKGTLTFESAEAQVLANLRAQALGAATVGALGLPEAFLRRVAGRIIQLSFQEKFRLVVSDRPGATEHEVWKPGAERADLPVQHVECPDGEFPEGPIKSAPARGFVPRVLEGDVPLERSPKSESEASRLVAAGLARDGLLVTAARALAAMPEIARASAGAAGAALARAGFPTDLLRHFTISGSPEGDSTEIPGWLVSKVITEPPGRWARVLKDVAFHYRPTVHGFKSSDDGGSGSAGIARIQLSRGGYWIGPGDGGSIDVLQQVLAALPSTRVIASIEDRHVPELRGAVAGWTPEQRDRLTLLSHPFAISQWAQDNAKGGHDASGPAVLIPRYATRGEEISLYVPGDTYAARGWAHAGLRVGHSPLLFQGGNLLTVREAPGRRVLLIGEAEVCRNQTLGLTRGQAIAALCAEMGCEKGVVLPAASIHIDYEVSCRVHDGRVTAFVLDTGAGARLVVEAGLRVLVGIGLVDSAAAATAMSHIAVGRFAEGCGMVWSVLAPAAVAPGKFPLPFAARFKDGISDSGVGNLHRLMAALDLLYSMDAKGLEGVQDANLRVYYQSLSRRNEDRTLLRASLRNLGWQVVPVPGIGQGDRSINPVNGLHTPNAYLMPAYGGLFRSVDEAAQQVVTRALGPAVPVVPIRTGESQRRDGALRCSVALW